MKELRGLCEKNRTKLLLFLNRIRPRVESSKTQGLFMKFARLKGYAPIWALGSGSDGLDLMIVRSNPGRRKKIGRSGA